ncbi:phage tail protein [Herbaspirillum robiniae]|uniref:phage tail protein n=1 Tax=Herbaspirillum robiniae TaxID=2014887 RepID=UPI0009A1AE30|nr:phage tail protein [Herbaspirillum robiniae]
MSTYSTVWTNIGRAKLANAIAQKKTLKLSRMCLGDGNGTLPTPKEEQVSLVREVYRGDLNLLYVDPTNASMIIGEMVVVAQQGGWWVREGGLLDEDGDLCVVANCPPSYKPKLEEGSVKDQVMRLATVVSNTASIEIKVDPAVVLATRKYTDDAIVAFAAPLNHTHADLAAKDHKHADLALINGSAQQQFSVAAGTDASHAVSLSQMNSAIATGIPAGFSGKFRRTTAPAGWLKENGAAVPVVAYQNLANAIYCGDTNNATALWGYRCTNQASPTTSRSTAGEYIVLPDSRGEYDRGWDDGRGIDSGRSMWSWQAGQNLAHSHTAAASTDGAHQHLTTAGNQGVGYQTGGASPVRENAAQEWSSVAGAHNHSITVNASGGSENLTRNLAALNCIKY